MKPLAVAEKMKSDIQRFNTGWIGIMLSLSDEDIEKLMENLLLLKRGEICHFHLRRHDFAGGPAIADVEISKMGADEDHDLFVE